jgi:hypothetical protein
MSFLKYTSLIALPSATNGIPSIMNGSTNEDPASVLWKLFQESNVPAVLSDFAVSKDAPLNCGLFGMQSNPPISMRVSDIGSISSHAGNVGSQTRWIDGISFAKETHIEGATRDMGPLFPAKPGTPVEYLSADLNGYSEVESESKKVYRESALVSSEKDGLIAVSTKNYKNPLIDYAIKKSGNYIVFIVRSRQYEEMEEIGYCYRPSTR